MEPVSPRLVQSRVTHLKVEERHYLQEIQTANGNLRFHEQKMNEVKDNLKRLEYFLAITRKELSELTNDGQLGPVL